MRLRAMRWGPLEKKPPPEPPKPPPPQEPVPRTHAPVWSIIGCGPSLDWTAIDPPGVVICVNRALEGATRCDYWAAIDTPNQEHARCEGDARRLMPKVITQKRKEIKWAKWKSMQLRTVSEPDHATSWVHKERHGGPRYTMVSSIAFAVENGAREIHFFGVDMAGRGYHTGAPERERANKPGHDDRYADRWAKRWAADRKELDQVRGIYQAASERGILMVGLPEHVTHGKSKRRKVAVQGRSANDPGVGPDRVRGDGGVPALREEVLSSPERADALGSAAHAAGDGQATEGSRPGATHGAPARQRVRRTEEMTPEQLAAWAEKLEQQAQELKRMVERLTKFAETQAELAKRAKANG